MERNSKNRISSKEKYRLALNNKRDNRGSATIEMTIILSVVLIIFYLYISIFLFFIYCAKDMAIMVESLYQQEEQGADGIGEMKIYIAGDKKTIQSQIGMKGLTKDLKFQRYNDAPIKNIRRWQLATDTILQGGTS